MCGGLREIRNEDGRVELRRRRGIAQVGVVRALVGVRHHRGILDDQIVETAALKPTSKINKQIRHHPAGDAPFAPRQFPPPRFGTCLAASLTLPHSANLVRNSCRLPCPTVSPVLGIAAGLRPNLISAEYY